MNKCIENNMNISREVNKEFNFLKPLQFDKLVRLGNKNDGGYVVPCDLTKKTDILISFGYGYDPSFEYDYINFTKKKTYVYDYTSNIFFLIKVFLKYFKRFITFRKKLKDVIYHLNNIKKHLQFINHKMINFKKKKDCSQQIK